jgi:1-acyl-sn-glycerol-3-phosphate acyltransferase
MEAGENEAGRDAELERALASLRLEIRTRFPAQRSESGVAAVAAEWPRIYTRLRRRLATLGMSERSGEVDEFGMDEVVVARMRGVLDVLFDRWFRVDLAGIEGLPERGPALLVANHSGLLPWDGLMLCHAVERHHASHARPRFLVADWLITLPFVHAYLARLGGVRACRENAERLLGGGHFVVAFPEGVKGAAKVFRERYRVKRFGRGGVVRVALETGVPLVPVGIVGAEEAHPLLFKWTSPARPLGLPFVPVTPTFPFLGALGGVPLPAKWVIRVGAPLPIDHLPADASSDELLVSRLTEELRSQVQSLVDVALAERASVWG